MNNMNNKSAPACFDVRKVLTANAMKQRQLRTPRAAYKPKPTMLKHEITAGIEYGADHARLSGLDVRFEQIATRLSSEFGGFTSIRGQGCYTHENGVHVNELCRTWVVITDKPIEPACEFIRAALNQESVLLVSTEPKLVKFVKG